ncbi:MAG: PorV/PorQ family protein [Bacteroidetes bacterium]|nr:PorV/PorQ family protein [Bacteroidota bacterium]MBR3090728.1 PorV/PorQ family protein [Bacteroidota bacterium]
MKKIFSIALGLALMCFSAQALKAYDEAAVGSSTGGSYAKVGLTGGQFLKVQHGARGAGLAGCVSSTVDDLSAVYWNPAGIAEIKSLSTEFDYTDWFAGFSHNYFAVGTPIGENFALAVHFTNFASDKMEYTTMQNPEGSNTFFKANDMSLGLTFAGYLTDQFSFGATVRYLDNSISDMNASGVSFDIGTIYRTGIQGLTLGVSLHGLTSDLTYSGRDLNTTHSLYPSTWSSDVDVSLMPSSFNIPLTFRAGVSADILKQDVHHLIGAFDFTTCSDTPEQFGIGAEYVWNDLLAARLGYRIGHDTQGLSGGIGIKYLTSSFSGRIDYAISPMGALGLVNRISVYIDLGRP